LLKINTSVKQILKQMLTFVMAILVLWAGNGYGVLEHSCEEHGKHQHILSNWVELSCEHEHHHDLDEQRQHQDSETHQHTDSGFEASHSEEQVNFVHFYAETESKTLVSSSAISPLFQEAVLPSFGFQSIAFSSEIHSSFSHIPLFRRTFGRLLLVLVQSFLI
jgi:hypothetical protein